MNRFLDSLENATIHDMMDMQNSSFSILAEECLPLLLENLDTSNLNSVQKRMVKTLKEWDYNYEANSTAAVIFDVWQKHFYEMTWDEMYSVRDSLPILMPETWRTIALLENWPESPFFDDKSEPTELSKNALEFCKSYHAAAQQTMDFSKELAHSGLLVDREAQINVAGNKRINFSGFKIIDEQKLAEMDDAKFLEWRKKGWLPFLYAHLFSGAQWQRLTYLLNLRLEKEAA